MSGKTKQKVYQYDSKGRFIHNVKFKSQNVK